MDLVSTLRNIEDALKDISDETREQAMLEEVEYCRDQRKEHLKLIKKQDNSKYKGLSKENYSPLLEEVIAGKTTFVNRLTNIGFNPIWKQNMHILSGPLDLHEYLDDMRYLDDKIAKLYHTKD